MVVAGWLLVTLVTLRCPACRPVQGSRTLHTLTELADRYVGVFQNTRLSVEFRLIPRMI